MKSHLLPLYVKFAVQAIEASNVVCDGLISKLILLMSQNGCGDDLLTHSVADLKSQFTQVQCPCLSG